MTSFEQLDDANFEILSISTSNPKKAFQDAKFILKKSQEIQYDKGIAEAFRNLAFCSQALGFLDEGFKFAKDAIVLFEKLGDKKNLAHVYNTLGFIYDHLNEQENRLISNLKSKSFSSEINDTEGLIRSLNNTGDNYIQLSNFNDALRSFEDCLILIQPTNHFMFAVVYCNIAEVYFILKVFNKAEEKIEQCLSHARKIKSSAIEATALLLLAKVNISIDKINDAHTNLKNAIQLFENTNKEEGDLIFLTEDKQENSLLKSSINIEVEIYHLYSELSEKLGDLNTALWAIKKAKTLEKKIINEKYSKEFETIHLKYEITQLENLVAERTVELERTLIDLKTKENNNQIIIENAIDAVIIFDENGKIIHHNKRTIEFFQKSNSLTNYSLSDLLVFEDGSEISHVIHKLFKNNQVVSESHKYEMCDIHFKEFYQVSLTKTINNNSYQGIAFIGNVSHYKRAEKNRLIDLEIETRINHFSQFILSKNDYRELVFELVRMCIQDLKFYNTTIYLKENNSEELVQIVSQQADTYSKNDFLNSMQNSTFLLSSNSYDFISSKDIKSRLSIPLKIADELIGIIDCGHYEEDFFTENHIRFLMTISPLLANRVDKLKEQIQKELLQKELFEINQRLEQEVHSQTKKVTELTHKYLEHEKLSLLADLASSISHELNTPFGIIKNGALEVSNSIFDLISSIENEVYDKEILAFIISVSQNKSIIPFVSSRQKRKILTEFVSFLSERQFDYDTSNELAELFVNANFSLSDKTDIEVILNNPKQREILKLIFFLQKTISISKSISHTIDNAALIVKELTNFAKSSNDEELTKVDLLENIESVISVYKYYLESVSINLEISERYNLYGNEINLFQLWKNAFLLAILCFDEDEIDNYIKLSATKTGTNILIELSFNGRIISENILNNILDVTPIISKSDKNILDKLSIIKKITTIHKGSFNIQSNNKQTSLYIELPQHL